MALLIINATSGQRFVLNSRSSILKGPTPVTLDDMWRMIWEQRSYSIVMVTSLAELGKVSASAPRILYNTPQLIGSICFAA